MRKRTVKLWRLHDDGRKLYAGTIEAADPRELVFEAGRRSSPLLRKACTSPPTGAALLHPSHHRRARAAILRPRRRVPRFVMQSIA